MSNYERPKQNLEQESERDAQQRPRETPAKSPKVQDVRDKDDAPKNDQADRVTGPTKDDARG